MAPAAAKKSKRKSAKGVGIDFKKVKHKVGRKLPPPQNATKVEFKSKAIVLPGQSVGQDKDGSAVNQRNKTLKELLNQAAHYSERMRKDALFGIKDLFLRHPKELEMNATTTIQKLSSRFTDVDKTVRHALLLVFRAILSQVPTNVMKPLVPFVMAHLGSAMTHMTSDIRLTAFSFLDLLLQHFPSLLVPSFTNQIIEHYDNFLKNGSTHGLESSAMLTVLSSLSRFLSVLGSSSSPKSPSKGGSSHRWFQKYDIQHRSQVSDGGLRALHEYKCMPAEISESFTGSLDNEGVSGRWLTATSSLVEVLLRCWAECAPAVCSSPLPDAVSLDCMVSITRCLCLLFEWLESLSSVNEIRLELRRRYVSSCASRLMATFPVPAPSVRTVAKVEECLCALNTGICEVMLHFLVPSPSYHDRFNFDGVLLYFENALAGKLLPTSAFSFAVNQNKVSETYIKALITFVPWVFECVVSWRFKLLQVLTDVFDSSSPQSNTKLACLSAISKILLSENHSLTTVDSMGEQFIKKWLQSFPRLLWELKDNHPASSKTILEMMLRLGKFAAAQSALATEFQMLQSAMIPFFCTIMPTKQKQETCLYGPFLKLPKDCQETAVDILYYISNFQPSLLKAISACCLCQNMDMEVLVRLLEVIETTYLKGRVEVPHYISFLLTCLVESCTLQGDEQLRKRQALTLGLVCRSLSQIGDGEAILRLLEKPMSEIMLHRSSPALVAAFLRVIATVSRGLGKHGQLELPEELQNRLSSQSAAFMVTGFQAKDQVALSILRYAIVVLFRNKHFGQSLMKELTSKLQGPGNDQLYAVAMLTTTICKQEGVEQHLAFSDVSEILSSTNKMLKEQAVKRGELKGLFHLETTIRAAFGSQVP